MLHIVYLIVIVLLLAVVFYQAAVMDTLEKNSNKKSETIRKLEYRLHDVINDYRRDRGATTITWTEFIRSVDVTLIPALPNGVPAKVSPIIRSSGIAPSARPSHVTHTNTRSTTTTRSSGSSYSNPSSYSSPSASYSDSGSSSSSSSCSSDSGSSSSSSCD